MGGGMRSDGGTPPIPAEVRKTIITIKEITGSHSDDEIYAMLKESNMDPDETTQKLLSEDPFHEVKRKRDKKKENVGNRDSGDSRSKPGNQGRAGRIGAFLDRGPGRESCVPCYNSYGAGKGFCMARNNRVYQSTNRGSNYVVPPSTTLQNEQTVAYASETSSLPASVSSNFDLPNGSSAYVRPSQVSKGSCSAVTVHATKADAKSANMVELPIQILSAEFPLPSAMVQGNLIPDSQHYITSIPTNSVSGVYSSSPDPVLVPSLDSRVSGIVGRIKCEVGTVGALQPFSEHSAISHSVGSNSFSGNLSQSLQLTQSSTQNTSESTVKSSGNDKTASEIMHPGLHDRAVIQSVQLDGDHVSEAQSQGYTAASRSSFVGNHYNGRPQQYPVGHQKAVRPNMEWKPKLTSQNSALSPRVIGTSTMSVRTLEVNMSSPLPSSPANLEDDPTKLQEKLEELNIRNDRDDQHVIIPNHLQVPEADRTRLSFGSFGAGFSTNLSSSFGKDDSNKSYTPQSEASQEGEKLNEEEPSSSVSSMAPFASNEDYLHHQKTSTSAVQNLSGSNDVTLSLIPTASSQSEASKPEPVVHFSSQYSVVQTVPNYSSIGLVPQIMRRRYPAYEPTEPQQQDVSRLPSFVQAYDPSTSYYTPFFRPGTDGDARFPALIGSSASSNYNGNVTLLSGQSVPLSQEVGNSLVLSTAGLTAQGAQTTRTPQITLPLPQQPLPMFPQPAGVHISHFPPNYLPYHQYLSPLYVPPPTIHSFAGNPGYPQPPSGSNYPLPSTSSYPPGVAALKYSLSQYKPGIASGNILHRGVPAGYGSYTTTPGYAMSPAVTGGSASGFDDIVGPQYKESNLYIPSQQAEGPAIWIQAPPRDLSGLQSSSYYNLQAQGQHATYAPSQSGHAAYAGLYHPTHSGLTSNVHHLLQQSQTLGGGVGVANAQAGAYQQSQHGQLNWSNNY